MIGQPAAPDEAPAAIPVETLGQRRRVDGLDDVEQLDRPTRLVRLQRPDQVPAWLLAGRPGRDSVDLGDLGLTLLDPVSRRAS
jgi:hypothetical protein